MYTWQKQEWKHYYQRLKAVLETLINVITEGVLVQFTAAYQRTFNALHALMSGACVMSRITNSKDSSGEDGEGVEPVHGVVAQQSLLPLSNGLSIFFTDVGLLYNQKKTTLLPILI